MPKAIIGNAGKRFVRFLLFGNYFLAFCIVALSFETTVKNNFSIEGISYYLVVFFSVVIYYTHAYITDSKAKDDTNLRSQWYYENRKLITATQIFYTLIVAYSGTLFIVRCSPAIQTLSSLNFFSLFVFPGVAMLYYGAVFPASFQFRLRNIAWLKPFIIGFVCTGAIVIYPMIFYSLQQNSVFHLSPANGLYFITNWLFTTVIAIMFDIKDFAADHNLRLKTFVVRKGLRFTIFFILLPLSVASFLSFFVFAFLQQFSFVQILINVIPFILLLYASTSLLRRRGILYYLVIIDGLLLVKALFGIITMTLL